MLFIRCKLHKDKNVVCFIYCFKTLKPLSLSITTFSFWLRIECSKDLLMLWLKIHLSSLKTLMKKCTIIKPLSFELLNVCLKLFYFIWSKNFKFFFWSRIEKVSTLKNYTLSNKQTYLPFIFIKKIINLQYRFNFPT